MDLFTPGGLTTFWEKKILRSRTGCRGGGELDLRGSSGPFSTKRKKSGHGWGRAGGKGDSTRGNRKQLERELTANFKGTVKKKKKKKVSPTRTSQ